MWGKIRALALILGILSVSIVSTHATITNTSTRTTTALGNGVTTNFTIGFIFQDNDEIHVYKRNETTQVVTEIQQGAGTGKFTITGGDPGTTVVMGSAVIPSTSERLIIDRVTSRTQTVDYNPHSSFPANSHEAQMDRFAQMIQELDYEVSTKIGLSTFSSADLPIFPDPVANRFILWDASAGDLTVAPSSTSTLTSGHILRFNGTEWGAYNLDNTLAALGMGSLTASRVVITDSTGSVTTSTLPSGDLVGGPVSAVDNAIVRFDGGSGKTIQNSGVTIDDSSNLTTAGNIVLSALTPNRALIVNNSNQIAASTTTSAELRDATKVQGKTVDTANIGDGKFLKYDSSSDSIVYANPTSSATSTITAQAYFASTASCLWANTQTTALGALSADTDCPAPTVVGNVGASVAGNVSTTDTDLPQITVNNLPAAICTVTVVGRAFDNGGAAIPELAIYDGQDYRGFSVAAYDGSAADTFVLVGIYKYGHTGTTSKTFSVHGLSSGGALRLNNNTNSGVQGLPQFKVHCIPL